MRIRRKAPRSLLSLVLGQTGLLAEADSVHSEDAKDVVTSKGKVLRGRKAAVLTQGKSIVSSPAARADFLPSLASMRRCASAPSVTHLSANSSPVEEFTGADAVVAAKRSAAIAAFCRAPGANGRVRPGSASCSASVSVSEISSCRSFVAPEGPRRRRAANPQAFSIQEHVFERPDTQTVITGAPVLDLGVVSWRSTSSATPLFEEPWVLSEC